MSVITRYSGARLQPWGWLHSSCILCLARQRLQLLGLAACSALGSWGAACVALRLEAPYCSMAQMTVLVAL